jgi:hypothetical protein
VNQSLLRSYSLKFQHKPFIHVRSISPFSWFISTHQASVQKLCICTVASISSARDYKMCSANMYVNVLYVWHKFEGVYTIYLRGKVTLSKCHEHKMTLHAGLLYSLLSFFPLNFFPLFSFLPFYPSMERLDQGHLHPLLEHLRQACPGRELNPRPPAQQVRAIA